MMVDGGLQGVYREAGEGRGGKGREGEGRGGKGREGGVEG